MIDENFAWNHHISYITNKISKSIGIIYKSRNFLNKTSLNFLYSSFVHSHLTYGNIAWGSSCKTSLDMLIKKQAHALRAINFVDRNYPSRPLFLSTNTLNVYQINILQIMCFMFKCKIKTAPKIFHDIYRQKQTKYPLRQNNQVIEQAGRIAKYVKFSITYRCPFIWNKLLATEETILPNLSEYLFKKKIKTLIVSKADNIFHFF